jgi:hypothetical protein
VGSPEAVPLAFYVGAMPLHRLTATGSSAELYESMPLCILSFFRYCSAWRSVRSIPRNISVAQGRRTMASIVMESATKVSAGRTPLRRLRKAETGLNSASKAMQSDESSKWKDSMARALYVVFRQEVSFKTQQWTCSAARILPCSLVCMHPLHEFAI